MAYAPLLCVETPACFGLLLHRGCPAHCSSTKCPRTSTVGKAVLRQYEVPEKLLAKVCCSSRPWPLGSAVTLSLRRAVQFCGSCPEPKVLVPLELDVFSEVAQVNGNACKILTGYCPAC